MDIDRYFDDSPEVRETRDYEHEFTWLGEPWYYTWEFRPLERPLTGLIIEGKNIKEPWELNLTVDYLNLLAQVCTQSARLIGKYGLTDTISVGLAMVIPPSAVNFPSDG